MERIMSVEPCNLLDAYHDQELGESQRRLFEEHLPRCAACSEALAQMRLLSRVLRGAALPALPGDVRARLRALSPIVRQRGVLRTAEWLTAAAAAVLVIGLFLLPRPQVSGAQQAVLAPWELTAVYATVANGTSAGGTAAATDPLVLADAIMSGQQYPWAQFDD